VASESAEFKLNRQENSAAPLFGAEIQSAALAAHQERAAKGLAARANKWAPKSQPKGPVFTAGGASLDAATFEVTLAAVNAWIGALAEVKGLLFSARRMPEQGNGRRGCGPGKSRSDEESTVRLSRVMSGLPELLANLVRSAADPEGSVGGVEKKSWSFWQSTAVWKSTQSAASLAARRRA
jgi:hypothetical protein